MRMDNVGSVDVCIGAWQGVGNRPSIFASKKSVFPHLMFTLLPLCQTHAKQHQSSIVRLALRTRVSLVSSSACIYRRICPQRKGLQAAIFHVRYRAVAASVAALCMVVAVGTVAVSTL